VLDRRKVPAESWLDAERLEERGGSGNGVYLLRVLHTRAAQIKIEADSGIAKQTAILAQIVVIGWGDTELRHFEPRELAVHRHERAGIRIRRRTQYDRIESRKRRRGAA